MASVAAQIALQEAQHMKHMVEQTAMSMAQAEMTHATSLLTEASKGIDQRSQMAQDAASHHHGAANKAADKVSQNLA